jgi:hypothetical protein
VNSDFDGIDGVLVWVFGGVALLFAVLLLSMAIIGCTGTTYDDVPSQVGGNPTYASIRASVIQPKCAACHGPGPRDLTTYAATMKYVVPGKPQESKLCVQVATGKMPLAGPLPQGEIDEICEWILDGALES